MTNTLKLAMEGITVDICDNGDVVYNGIEIITYLESAQYELEQLNFWFKMNKEQQGTDEWNNNIERGIDLSETVNNL